MLPHLALNGFSKDAVIFTLEDAWKKGIEHDNHVTLFRYEDWPAWVTFTTVFAFLIVFDNVVLNRNPKALTMTRALCYTFFWVLCAMGFACWVGWYYSEAHAWMWISGYTLEWMLSFDNLFVFHMIFQVYGCPDHLKHRPLYLGICGAVFFRLVFIFAGEFLMHALFFTHFIFGAFLIYTGVKTITTDEEDDDPSQQPLVLWLQNKIPFVNVYDEQGRFFVRVPVTGPGSISAQADASSGLGGKKGQYGSVDLGEQKEGELRATMLFLVLICLEASDLLFAVDSVSAIVAQVNDLFLAYTSAVFAMLGLRAMFFIIDVLAKLFSLLKYGVGAVLVMVGVKLIMSRFYHVPPAVVCLVLFSTIGASMVASVIKEKYFPEAEEEEEEKVGVA